MCRLYYMKQCGAEVNYSERAPCGTCQLIERRRVVDMCIRRNVTRRANVDNNLQCLVGSGGKRPEVPDGRAVDSERTGPDQETCGV